MPGRGPLLNTAADQRLFVADDSRRRAVAATEQPRNVLISGEPGSGKTTVLYRALERARAAHRPALLLGGRLATGSHSLTDALLDVAAEEEWLPDAPPPAVQDPLGPARQVRRLREAPQNALALLDDLTIDQAQTLFGQLRDELWQTPVTFTAAVGPEVAQALTIPPADAFFDQRLTLQPLAGEDADELLRKRADAGESTLVSVGRIAPRQPRALLALAAGEMAAYDPARQHELLTQATELAGRPGAMLLAELWARDGVSASDLELQRRLGVTRNRLTELLRTLASHGILSSYAEPRAGKTGRPRELYFVRQ
jgi:RecA/RadA recombinase